MAEIAVERRSGGIPWWVWLLAALLVGAIIWWIVDAREPENRAYYPAQDATMPAATTAGTVTTANALFAGDVASLEGRRVELSDPVSVTSVTGDRTFWVSGNGQQMLVVLDQQPTPGATEGRYDINAGQTVRIWGDVRRFPGFDEARSRWNVGENMRAQLENQRVYIHANRLEVVSRP